MYLGKKNCLKVKKETVDSFLNRRTIGPQARANEISHLKGFYRWCVDEELLEIDPTARIKRPKLARGLPRPMPQNDFEMALKLAPERIRPWLCLAAYAGLRACEIAQLRGEDIIWSGTPTIIIRRQKGGDMGSVPLSPQLQVELKMLPKRGPLFPKRDRFKGELEGTQITAMQVSHLTNKFLREVGIESTFHSLRHWFGTEVYKASERDLRRTQELMRHRTPVATAIYTYVDPGISAEVVAALPSSR